MEPIQRGNIRLAATLLLLRDAAAGPEVFMVKRPGSVVFPDLHVFPGGKVDDGDHLEPAFADIDDRYASTHLGVSAGGLRYWVAAIRECFEEVGVLLATRAGRLLDFEDPQERARFAVYRADLAAGRMTLPELCVRENLVLACSALTYFSHWLTPPSVEKRFDTRFFVTTMPRGQHALADTEETADSDWITPTEALRRRARNEWQMIHPTWMTLDVIRGFEDVSSTLRAVMAESHLPVLTPELNGHGMQSLR
jgi:8-oxo-dGTP pyrophosphatase MutT (NUDIX family)